MRCLLISSELYAEKHPEDWSKIVKKYKDDGEVFECSDEMLKKQDIDKSDYTPMKQPVGFGTQKLIHFTYVFQSFVFMQIFNQFNARKLEGEMNIFSGMFRNPLFVYITILPSSSKCSWLNSVVRSSNPRPLTPTRTSSASSSVPLSSSLALSSNSSQLSGSNASHSMRSHLMVTE